MTNVRIVFFGTDPLALPILAELERTGFTPTLIIAGRDKLDRKRRPLPPPEKAWADARAIPVLQPERITREFLDGLRSEEWDLFIVASYGKILPASLLSIPKHGVLNVHPSLLPRLRGSSPIRSAILTNEKDTGVTIMLMDSEMDHGPIIAQKKVPIPDWPPRGRALDALLADEGAKLLASIIPLWLNGDVEAREQNHDVATYCHYIEKEHAEIDLSHDAETNLRKIRAYDGWPTAFTYFNHANSRIRVQIIDAHIEGTKLVIDRVKPEGKSEMGFPEFLRKLG